MLMIACQNRPTGTTEAIVSAFTGPCTGKYVNLEKVLGDSFLIHSSFGIQAFKVKFLPKSEYNLVTGTNGEVLYRGPAVRFRDRYYLAKTNPDSAYWVAAFEHKRNLIKGFAEFEAQMRLIDDTLRFWTRSEVNRPGFIIAAGKDKISLDPNEKVLHVLYANVMAQLPWDTLEIVGMEKEKNANPYTLVEHLSSKQVGQSLSITFRQRKKHSVFITNTLGETVLEEGCWCKNIELEMKDLPAGTYQLTVAVKSTGDTESIPIEKK